MVEVCALHVPFKLLLYKTGEDVDMAVFVFTLTIPHLISSLSWLSVRRCVGVFANLSLFGKRGGKGRDVLPVTPSTPVTHLSSTLSLHMPSLHPPPLPLALIFVFQ